MFWDINSAAFLDLPRLPSFRGNTAHITQSSNLAIATLGLMKLVSFLFLMVCFAIIMTDALFIDLLNIIEVWYHDIAIVIMWYIHCQNSNTHTNTQNLHTSMKQWMRVHKVITVFLPKFGASNNFLTPFTEFSAKVVTRICCKQDTNVALFASNNRAKLEHNYLLCAEFLEEIWYVRLC